MPGAPSSEHCSFDGQSFSKVDLILLCGFDCPRNLFSFGSEEWPHKKTETQVLAAADERL